MGAHRKPKTRPTAVAAVVTAAIAVPAGTAAAASYGGIGPASAAGHRSSPTSALVANISRPSTATNTATNAPKPVTKHLTIGVKQLTASPSASATAKASASASPSTSASASSTSTGTAAAASSTSSDAFANLTMATLEPTGLYGSQQYFTPSSAQWANAETIVAVAKQRGLKPYAAVIAVATAMQESSLINLTTASDADSLGLFQQRPSMGWGTAAEVTNTTYATNAFFAALNTYAPNYLNQSLWESAQAVQRSGFPTAYAQWQAQAAKIVLAIANGTAP